MSVPSDLQPDLAFKVLTHGFYDNINLPRYLAFVDAWMEATDRRVNVILVNWATLATALQMTGLEDYAYNAVGGGSRNLREIFYFILDF